MPYKANNKHDSLISSELLFQATMINITAKESTIKTHLTILLHSESYLQQQQQQQQPFFYDQPYCTKVYCILTVLFYIISFLYILVISAPLQYEPSLQIKLYLQP